MKLKAAERQRSQTQKLSELQRPCMVSGCLVEWKKIKWTTCVRRIHRDGDRDGDGDEMGGRGADLNVDYVGALSVLTGRVCRQSPLRKWACSGGAYVGQWTRSGGTCRIATRRSGCDSPKRCKPAGTYSRCGALSAKGRAGGAHCQGHGIDPRAKWVGLLREWVQGVEWKGGWGGPGGW
jgi:hypothetical protein